MNKSIKKKISRRDAIKLLGAITGASVLANLPSKWSTPEITRGVLPAHAQTSCMPVSGSQTFSTPDSYSFTVPACVTILNVLAYGAQGSNTSVAFGGRGGLINFNLSVVPGEILTIFVGSAGENANGLIGGLGGSINGGKGGDGSTGFSGGGGGGGSSSVLRNSNGNFEVIAGGGGGAGTHAGGAGGGEVGGTGGGSNGATGGTQLSAGLSGGGSGGATDGSNTQGGNGSNGFSGGGGGGGGYYGGGGGGNNSSSGSGGGGGGSSFPTSSAGAIHLQNQKSGDGQVILSW